MRVRKSLRTELSRTVIRSPGCFPETQKLYCFRFHTCQYTFGQGFLLFSLSLFFLCQAELFTPTRNCSVNTEMIYRMNNSEQELGVRSIRIEVFPAILLCQNSTIQSTNTLGYWMTCIFESFHHFEWLWSPIFLQVCKEEFHTTSLRLQDRETSSVPARSSSRIP